MGRKLTRWARNIAAGALIVVLTIFAVRVWESQRGAPLKPWHLVVPRELSRQEIDRADWAGWLAAENNVFRTVAEEVIRELPDGDLVPENRYYDASPVNPARFQTDWNRTFVMEPSGPPTGAVVLLHGLTDSPFSMRHLARLYSDRGFVALAIRLPGHGTVPAGLTDATWEDWMAATRLAVREARRKAPSGALHIVGYSNGGALALKYALDALGDPALPKPDRIVLVSPMIGVTSFARFAGLAALPAHFPAFAKAAWLSVVPEFNPFKYNSFPVAAATQSHRLTQAVQAAVRARARDGVIEGLAPVLTFQSVMDFTVSSSAILSALYAHLPANGSEIVLFDINRSARFGPLLRRGSEYALSRLLPVGPQRFRITVVTNVSPADADVMARVIEPGETAERSEALGLSYPRDVYSLSHVALPFPVQDGLYGVEPDRSDDFGVRLGTLAARGEVGVLLVNLESLMRMSSNPFFPFLARRIGETLRR
ncbi:alpha/beta hydrolase [Alsobacter sp. SYSU M60028]|uniref:Alpha/beta hydrolase n=1 Tax=Alsobacter ponti TaxID=2962936 RepID=A0ABT1LBU1_9HYPH|nr:alpha/beta hydrolase [Alsobacter ponti]MCP8938225.1 alpha/beta hydrolase [Alsobacter ponti]